MEQPMGIVAGTHSPVRCTAAVPRMSEGFVDREPPMGMRWCTGTPEPMELDMRQTMGLQATHLNTVQFMRETFTALAQLMDILESTDWVIAESSYTGMPEHLLITTRAMADFITTMAFSSAE